MFRVKFVCEWSCDYDVDCYDVWTDLSKEDLIKELDKVDRTLIDCDEDGYEDLGHNADTLVDALKDLGIITSAQFVCGVSEVNRPDCLVISMVDIEYEMR